MTENEIVALIRMQFVPGLGPVRARKLIGLAGSPTAVFTDKSLIRRLRMPAGVGEHLLKPEYLDRAGREYASLMANGWNCLPFTSPEYPALLLECADHPIMLYGMGNMNLRPDRPALAVVGTRKMTSAGKNLIQKLIAELRELDPLIISGFAYGVDICAQKRAMDLGMQTVACLAHGLDTLYPPEHARYRDHIMERGGFVTEFPVGTPPEPGHFIRRNRIIAGLTHATLVVESPERGGSLVTADLAFGYDRQVFAIPGRPGDSMSAGCNALIRNQKAELVTNAEELMESMQWNAVSGGHGAKSAPEPEITDPLERKIWDVIGAARGVHLDEIAVKCGFPVSRAARVLFSMELRGIVRAYPGKRYGKSGV